MNILANCTVIKLKEYNRSYGKPETIEVPFIFEYVGQIWLINELGTTMRKLKIGTKLLIKYDGKTITHRAYTIRINKANKARSIKMEAEKLKYEKQVAENEIISNNQLKLWDEFLATNPEKVTKYISKIIEMPSSKWRNYLRLKAAKHINDGKFNTLLISPSELKQKLTKYNILNDI